MLKIKDKINQFVNLLDKDDPFFYGQSKLTNKFFSKLLYCPHPFTNWSLNPHTKYNEVLMHTKEGFRKTSNSNSILEELKYYNNECDVYCIGGSTTYCVGLKDYSDTWDFLDRQVDNVLNVSADVQHIPQIAGTVNSSVSTLFSTGMSMAMEVLNDRGGINSSDKMADSEGVEDKKQ